MNIQTLIYSCTKGKDYDLLCKPITGVWSTNPNMKNCLQNFLSSSIKDDNDAWLFFCDKMSQNCMLIRKVEVTDAKGYVIYDRNNRPIISIEGFCCDYEDRREFFALIPSLIYYVRMNSISLYTQIIYEGNTNTVTPNLQIIINPYEDERNFPNYLRGICQFIRFNSIPISFLYGRNISELKNNISFINGYHLTENTLLDALYGIPVIHEKEAFCKIPEFQIVQKQKKITQMNLILRIEDVGYRWKVMGDDVCYQTDLIYYGSPSMKNRETDSRKTMLYVKLDNEVNAIMTCFGETPGIKKIGNYIFEQEEYI